jgi:IS1 family transposase
LPTSSHQKVGKETGETAHIERLNNTLRQRIGRMVRKTLSFSKKEYMLNLHFKLSLLIIIIWIVSLNFLPLPIV